MIEGVVGAGDAGVHAAADDQAEQAAEVLAVDQPGAGAALFEAEVVLAPRERRDERRATSPRELAAGRAADDARGEPDLGGRLDLDAEADAGALVHAGPD